MNTRMIYLAAALTALAMCGLPAHAQGPRHRPIERHGRLDADPVQTGSAIQAQQRTLSPHLRESRQATLDSRSAGEGKQQPASRRELRRQTGNPSARHAARSASAKGAGLPVSRREQAPGALGQVSGEPYNPHRVAVDPTGVISSVRISRDGRLSDFAQRALSDAAFSNQDFPRLQKQDSIRVAKSVSKISPVLEQWLRAKRPNEPVDVIVTFREDTRVPLLPDLRPGEARGASNTARARAIEQLRQQRVRFQAPLVARFRQLYRFQPTETFWLVNAVAGRVDLGNVPKLADDPQVTYVQPVEGGERPPQDSNSNNDTDDARRLIVSDPYFSQGLSQPWMGLMDTGVRRTHVLFNSPSHLAFWLDCVNGGPNGNNASAPGYDPNDSDWNHGTSSAAILTGNNRLGNAFRGVTGVQLDSFKIYTKAGLNSTAAIRAIQRSVAVYDKVLVGELQAWESESGAIATAADNAYNAGIVIVAANGNFGYKKGTVRSPAIAHKVLGVGAFMTDGQSQYHNQGRGPATDGRYKPDIQAPTWTETASNTSDTAMQVFTGTSGAVPYTGGAAMLAYNWMKSLGTHDFGQTYAFMILYGQDPYPYDNTVGAGPLKMATDGQTHWGKVYIMPGSTCDIKFQVPPGARELDGALWWPESATQAHNDIDLHLIDPIGVVRARGLSAVSVFERARVPGYLTPGTWTFRIRGYKVRTFGQLVYWAECHRNN